MTYTTYEINNCSQYLGMLSEQFKEFKKDPTSSRKAILTTILAYHLREWLWNEHEARISEQLSIQDVSEYNKHINDACPNFEVIRQLCNGSKHYKYDEQKDGQRIVKSTKLEKGDFSHTEFRPALDIGVLIIDTEAGKINAIDLLSKAIEYYESLFSDWKLQKKR